MKKGWTKVALGEILRHRTDAPAEEKIALGQVQIVSKIKFNTGTLEFRQANGTKTKMIRICPGDIVFSGINAAKGAIAIYPKDADKEASATIHYSSYEVNESKAETKFLWWLLRSSAFREILDIYLPGGIKTELKPKRLLPIPIFLPPIREQKLIISHLDAIEARLIRIQGKRVEQEQELQAALRSAFQKIEIKSEWIKMGEIAPLHRRPIEIEPDGKYPELGARSFGRGIFHKPTLNGSDLTWQKLFHVHSGDIVFSNIKAWEGAIAVAGESDHNRFGSHRYLTCVVDSNRALPEFVCFYLLTNEGLEKIGKASPGSADRNRTLSVKRLENITVPIPPLEMQQDFQALLRLRNKIQFAEQNSHKHIAAPLPSVLDQIFNGLF